jgi:hypothetical protein
MRPPCGPRLRPTLQLALLAHMQEFHAGEGTLGSFERFASEHRTRAPFYGSMAVVYSMRQILHLADGDSRAVRLIIAFDRGRIGVTAIKRARFRQPVAADRLLQLQLLDSTPPAGRRPGDTARRGRTQAAGGKGRMIGLYSLN